MISIVSQNKYVEGQRDDRDYFLDIVYCTKNQFCKESVKRIVLTDRYELLCVISGEVYLPGSKKKMDKNGVILMQKFSQTELRISENTEMIHIGFTTSLEFPFLDSGNHPVFFENFANVSLVHKLYRLICLNNQVLGIKEAMLLEVLYDMNDNHKATSSEILLYHRACDWIENNSLRAITARDVAVALNCSRAHLNRVIKAASGECLGNVIARYRLERIKNLCDSGNVSVSEIAHILGFYSTELLCKFFKYHDGISITEYKKRNRM